MSIDIYNVTSNVNSLLLCIIKLPNHSFIHLLCYSFILLFIYFVIHLFCYSFALLFIYFVIHLLRYLLP